MRPSNSMSFEPGMERGVPWGRDLFTFVTSAAGHMMRTLQRPRKNRPSKRQVNHRRFLHNMIQRKFAEIEAANHQLASVLFSTDVANSNTPSPSQHPIMADQSDSTSKAPKSAGARSPCSTQTENLAVEHSEPGDNLSLNPKQHMDQSNGSTPSEGTYRQGVRLDDPMDCGSPRTSEKTKDLEQGGEHFLTEPFRCETASEESLCSWIDSIREKYETQLRQESDSNTTLPPLNQRALPENQDVSTINQTPLSPGLSHLSLDSCDFGVIAATEISACCQSQNNMADGDTVESQRMDMMRFWDSEEKPLDDGSFGDFMDPHLETIWGSQGEEGNLATKVHIDDVTFLNQSDSFIEKLMLYTSSSTDSRSEMELIDCFRGQYDSGQRYRCSVDPVSAFRDFLNGQGSSQCMLESTLERQGTDRQLTCLNATPNQLYSSIGYHCNLPDTNMLQSSCPQPDSTFSLVKDDLNQNCIPFAGVARSFPAPIQTPQPSHPVLTPPLGNDWLFTDIMEDGGLSV